MGIHQGNGEEASRQNDSTAELEEIGAFARARLTDTRAALLALHRDRCGSPPTAFALDQNGSRYVPTCLCDRDIRRSLKDLKAQHQIVETVMERPDDVIGSRILRTLAGAFADHPDFLPGWAQPA